MKVTPEILTACAKAVGLTEVPETWTIIDASKLKEFMDCPRKYFYRHILGWEADVPSVHLEFGVAWHKAMEHILLHGKSDEAVQGAYEAFLSHYRKFFPPETDDSRAPKIPENVLRGLMQYCIKYNNDEFDVLYTEVAGTVMVDDDRIMHWRMDNILRRPDGLITSLEHKTAYSVDTRWQDQWPLSIQIGLYLHVLHCLYGMDKVHGITVNGACIRNEPKIKKDGTPYANARDNEFLRVPVRRSAEMMQAWQASTVYWLHLLDYNMEMLAECKPEDDVLTAFPCNPESCTKWGRCPFMDFCTAWANPLQRAQEPPFGFAVNWWNPKDEETKVSQVFHLEDDASEVVI